ncbi:MAG TPA: NAD(P)-binding domain-containing protein [Acidimicrobiia bacterium]|nr:NAD(P)-binding domain-containing protein [Acidimicrobiia bacterium]
MAQENLRGSHRPPLGIPQAPPRFEPVVKIGIVGAGRIGGNLATQWARRGHDVLISFKRDRGELAAMADAAGAASGSVGDAVAYGDVVVVSVPWATLDTVAAEAGVGDKPLIDTTNPYAAGGFVGAPGDASAAEYNARRFATARLVKAFNTYTSAFQAEVGDGRHSAPVAMFLGGEDAGAKEVASTLVRDTGFEPVDLGGWSTISLLEAPRRPGAVYGEEYSPDAARRIAAAAATDLAGAARLAEELKKDG